MVEKGKNKDEIVRRGKEVAASSWPVILPVFRKKEKDFPKFIEHPFLGLLIIATSLNAYHETGDSPWKEIEEIIDAVTSPDPWPGIEKFNRLLKENPFPLTVTMMKADPGMTYPPGYKLNPKGPTVLITTGSDTRSPLQIGLWLLWLHYFQNKGWERLKRCQQCGRWFVDQTKNKQKARCSKKCTWSFWNAENRKKAGHRPRKKKREGD